MIPFLSSLFRRYHIYPPLGFVAMVMVVGTVAMVSLAHFQTSSADQTEISDRQKEAALPSVDPNHPRPTEDITLVKPSVSPIQDAGVTLGGDNGYQRLAVVFTASDNPTPLLGVRISGSAEAGSWQLPTRLFRLAGRLDPAMPFDPTLGAVATSISTTLWPTLDGLLWQSGGGTPETGWNLTPVANQRYSLVFSALKPADAGPFDDQAEEAGEEQNSSIVLPIASATPGTEMWGSLASKDDLEKASNKSREQLKGQIWEKIPGKMLDIQWITQPIP